MKHHLHKKKMWTAKNNRHLCSWKSPCS